MDEQVIAAWGQIFAAIAAAVSIIVAIHGVKQQLWLTVFSDYTKRYSEIMATLPFEARDPNSEFDLNSVSAGEKRRILEIIRNYLNLCSEEFFLHQRKKIDREIWMIWRRGIIDTMRLPCFREAWSIICHEYALYPEFSKFISQEALSATSTKLNDNP